VERVIMSNPDVFAPFFYGIEQPPSATAPTPTPAAFPAAPDTRLNSRRGVRRLGVVLAITLSALLGLLLWLIDLAVVFVWLLGVAAAVWGVIRAVQWVLAGFRGDSADTVAPCPPNGK